MLKEGRELLDKIGKAESKENNDLASRHSGLTLSELPSENGVTDIVKEKIARSYNFVRMLLDTNNIRNAEDKNILLRCEEEFEKSMPMLVQNSNENSKKKNYSKIFSNAISVQNSNNIVDGTFKQVASNVPVKEVAHFQEVYNSGDIFNHLPMVTEEIPSSMIVTIDIRAKTYIDRYVSNKDSLDFINTALKTRRNMLLAAPEDFKVAAIKINFTEIADAFNQQLSSTSVSEHLANIFESYLGIISDDIVNISGARIKFDPATIDAFNVSLPGSQIDIIKQPDKKTNSQPLLYKTVASAEDDVMFFGQSLEITNHRLIHTNAEWNNPLNSLRTYKYYRIGVGSFDDLVNAELGITQLQKLVTLVNTAGTTYRSRMLKHFGLKPTSRPVFMVSPSLYEALSTVKTFSGGTISNISLNAIDDISRSVDVIMDPTMDLPGGYLSGDLCGYILFPEAHIVRSRKKVNSLDFQESPYFKRHGKTAMGGELFMQFVVPEDVNKEYENIVAIYGSFNIIHNAIFSADIAIHM